MSQNELPLVAIAMACGATYDDAWTIVDRLADGLSPREASRIVSEEARAGSWAGHYA